MRRCCLLVEKVGIDEICELDKRKKCLKKVGWWVVVCICCWSSCDRFVRWIERGSFYQWSSSDWCFCSFRRRGGLCWRALPRRCFVVISCLVVISCILEVRWGGVGVRRRPLKMLSFGWRRDVLASVSFFVLAVLSWLAS